MKAIIMAGGEGTRLRPLTNGLPKPMVRLFDKPVMEYIVDLLENNGFSDICATLRYMPEKIMEYFGRRLHYMVEESPLGTAGSVKNCRDFIGGEDFLVISGDAVCDFNLKEAIDFHHEKQAAVTVVTFRHPEPLEYGLVQTDDEGRIIRFFEKPGWEQVFTDRVNTGIYVINPHVLERIPSDRPFDFSKDLFPALMASNEKIYACELHGNWCDIGDCSELQNCARDMLGGKYRIRIPANELSPGLWSNGPVPGNVTFIAPCYIGRDVRLGENCFIGPNTLICNNSVIGSGAHISESIVMGAKIGKNAHLDESIVTPRTIVDDGARLPAGTVTDIGSEHSSSGLGAKLRSRREMPAKAAQGAPEYRKDDGGCPEPIDGRGRITGELNSDITLADLISLGVSLAGLGTVGLGCDGSSAARLACDALACGVRSAGGHGVSHDAAFATQASLAAIAYRFPYSVFCSAHGSLIQLSLMGADGLPLAQPERKSILNALRRNNHPGNECSPGVLSSVSGIPELCLSFAGKYSLEPGKTVNAAILGDSHAAGFAKRLLAKTGVNVAPPEKGCVRFCIDSDGSLMSITDEKGDKIHEAKLWLLLAHCILAGGEKRLCVPHWAPDFMETLGKEFSAEIRRVTVPGRHEHIPLPLRDGAIAAACLCHFLAQKGAALSALVRELPDISAVSTGVPINSGRASAMRELSSLSDPESDCSRGLLFRRKEGTVRIRPSSSISALRIFVESNSSETAMELCAEYERVIKNIDGRLSPAGEG